MSSKAFEYQAAGQWADHVRALAIIESNENDTLIGDDGRAFGLLQQHPDFYDDWCCAIDGDSWATAQIRAAARFFTAFMPLIDLDLTVQAYHLGADAVRRQGKRDPQYLKRFSDAFQWVRSKGVA